MIEKESRDIFNEQTVPEVRVLSLDSSTTMFKYVFCNEYITIVVKRWINV